MSKVKVEMNPGHCMRVGDYIIFRDGQSGYITGTNPKWYHILWKWLTFGRYQPKYELIVKIARDEDEDASVVDFEDLSLTGLIISIILFVIIGLTCVIAYLCAMIFKYIAWLVLYPICLLILGWIEYPVWKGYRELDHQLLRASPTGSGWHEDQTGHHLIHRKTIYGAMAGNFFVWFWKRMYDKNHV